MFFYSTSSSFSIGNFRLFLLGEIRWCVAGAAALYTIDTTDAGEKREEKVGELLNNIILKRDQRSTEYITNATHRKPKNAIACKQKIKLNTIDSHFYKFWDKNCSLTRKFLFSNFFITEGVEIAMKSAHAYPIASFGNCKEKSVFVCHLTQTTTLLLFSVSVFIARFLKLIKPIKHGA